ncbi:MAG: helix-turn-helix transcriptional regulator [Clostridia bacterium]|nr:helix-turn-helix transcriptional regulator [Clostridia bacterium]
MEQRRDPLLGTKELYEIGDNIREKRQDCGLTQMALATLMDTDPRVISRHESGNGMDLETMLRYSLALRCNISDLMPRKYRKGALIPQLQACFTMAAILPDDQQEKLSKIIKGILDMAA